MRWAAKAGAMDWRMAGLVSREPLVVMDGLAMA